jgi:hypothetical protein
MLWATRKNSNGSEITTIVFDNTAHLDVWETLEEIVSLSKGKK